MDAALNSTALLLLILVADFAITSLHSYQEWKGLGAPLWRNFGAIVGFDFPDRCGFWLFTATLTLFLFAIGFVGIIGPTGTLLDRGCFGRRDGAYALDHHGIAHRQSAPWVRFPQAKAPKICWAMRLRTVIMAASPYGNAERHRIAKSKTRYGRCG